MRRTMFVFAVAATACLTFAATASAIGPGGWDHVGVGASSTAPSLNGHVFALNSQRPGILYVGGDFTSAGGNQNAKRIARWNGSAWTSLGTTPLSNGSVFALAYHAGHLFVGGTFLNAGGNPNADFLAEWTGSAWVPFCTSTAAGPAFGGSVQALQIIGNTLYVGGSFQNGAAIDAADYLLACDLTTGASSSTVAADNDLNGGVYALTADSNGVLYAGGQFNTVAGNTAARHVAAYQGGSWSALGGGTDDYVRSLTAAGTNVYVGTDSVNVGGISRADHVVRWNGTAWSALGSNSAGTNGWFPASSFINALTTYGSFVFAAGSFQNANGVAAADEIAYFDGAKWRAIGSDGAGNGPLPGALTALAIFGGKVYAAGNFTKAGGDVRGQFLAAYALRLPDACIGATPTSRFSGNGVYSQTGAGEGRTVHVVRGKSSSVYVKVQNDGLTGASFTIKGTGGARGITARYYKGASNITTRVQAGTYATGSIAARGVVLLRVLVTATKTSAGSATFVVTARSVAGTPPDAVRVVVKAH